ncbi:hypothetical protein ABZ835_20265 [Streptomyces sp. NPDC047461]|uniref:hypothetical protein n=1 Tax=Streptomyces sp. NPDC047461 TaxID=3155619 RepID=UPI0033C4404E
MHDGTRLLHGERTRTTDVSTTTWVDARLHAQAGPAARLDLIRAATGITHAVVSCRELNSTVTAAARLTLQLEEQRGRSAGVRCQPERSRLSDPHSRRFSQAGALLLP